MWFKGPFRGYSLWLPLCNLPPPDPTAGSRRNGHGFMYVVPLLPLKRFLRIALRHALLTVGRVELYKDIKGRRAVIHSAFQLNLLTSDYGQSNPYGEAAEGCLWAPPLHLTCAKRKNYISLTANDWIFIAICAPPFILPLPLTDSSLHLQRWAINAGMLWVCVIRKNHTYVFHAY